MLKIKRSDIHSVNGKVANAGQSAEDVEARIRGLLESGKLPLREVAEKTFHGSTKSVAYGEDGITRIEIENPRFTRWLEYVHSLANATSRKTNRAKKTNRR